MSNPVRIYVIYHPDSPIGKKLTNEIYAWFRRPNLEGIPVYIRSQPAIGKKVPADPQGKEESLEYLIPLVDANLVRDVAWHDYLLKLASQCLPDDSDDTKGWVMFPVALDGTAFNLPAPITQRNFVRFTAQALPYDTSPHPASEEQSITSMLKDITEALSRDLNARIFPQQAGRKLKIFISYARADGANVPRAMRDYIQGQTQCEAFFDENDISYGSKYEDTLSMNAGDQTRALIVVAGDHYADRPVCRWEIRKFTKPTSVSLTEDTLRRIHLFHPVIVLSTLSDSYISRVVPELGQSPTLRWEPGREMIVFSMLIRAVLFGARNVLAAREISGRLNTGIVVNRLPGPVALKRLLDDHPQESRAPDGSTEIHYPGNGLPLLELRLLETTFKNCHLTAFRDIDRHLPDPLKFAIRQRQRPLHEKVIGISYGFSERLNSLGYLPQHLEEAIVHLLRPLLRLGADIMYGGNLPTSGNPTTKEENSSTVSNMNMTLMNMVSDELSIAGIDGVQEETDSGLPVSPSRLFNPISWPKTNDITAEDEAALINTCSVFKVLIPEIYMNERKKSSPSYHACRALALSHSRELMAAGFKCPVPGNLDRVVVPMAMIFVGGRTNNFSGCMPGILEELFGH